MRRYRYILLIPATFAIFCGLSLLTSICSGAGVPAFSLGSMIKQSSLIVVAKVGTVQRVGEGTVSVHGQPYTAQIMQASAKVKYVLKGSVRDAELGVRFSIPISPGGSVGYGAIPSQQNRVLFLKTGAGNTYEATDPYYPSLPAAEDVTINANATLEEQVASVECATIASQDASPDQRIEAIEVLRGRSDPCTSDALIVAFESADQRLRLTASAALLRRNETQVLKATIQEMMQLVPDSYLRLNILSDFRDGIKNEASVPELVLMLQDSDPITRRAAASALRNIGTPHCLIPLAKALADPDKTTRYYAVTGLAEIENDPREKPSMEDFDNDEEPYLRFWKEWVKDNLREASSNVPRMR